MIDDSHFDSFLNRINYLFDDLTANIEHLRPHKATFDSVTLPTDYILDQVQEAVSQSNEKNRELESMENMISEMNMQIQQNENTTEFEEANKSILKNIQDEYIKQGVIEEKNKSLNEEIKKLNEELLDFNDFVKQTEGFMRKDLNTEMEAENQKFEKFASEISENIGDWFNSKLEIEESLFNCKKENEMLKTKEKNIVLESDLTEFESGSVLRLKNVIKDLYNGINKVSEMFFENESNDIKLKKDDISDIIKLILQLNSNAVYRKNMFNEEVNFEDLYKKLYTNIKNRKHENYINEEEEEEFSEEEEIKEEEFNEEEEIKEEEFNEEEEIKEEEFNEEEEIYNEVEEEEIINEEE